MTDYFSKQILSDIFHDLQKIAPTAIDYYPDTHPTPYIVLRTPSAVFDGDDNMNRYRRQTVVIDVYDKNRNSEVIEDVRKELSGVHFEYGEQPYAYNQLFQAEFTFEILIRLNDEGGIF